MIGDELIQICIKKSKENDFTFDDLFSNLLIKEIFISFDSENELDKFEFLAEKFGYYLTNVDYNSFSKLIVYLTFENKSYQFVEYADTYTSHSRYRICFKNIEFLFTKLLDGWSKPKYRVSNFKNERDYEIKSDKILLKRIAIPITFDFYDKRLIDLFEKEYGEKLNFKIIFKKIYIKELTSFHVIKYYHSKQNAYYQDFINWAINYNHTLQIYNLVPSSLTHLTKNSPSSIGGR